MAKLFFYYSAMNAGKSTALLQSSYNYKERGMETILFTPSLDTRNTPGMIYSRIGLAAKAVPFDKTFDLYEFVKTKQPLITNLQCVLVDEAQFLTKQQVFQLTEIVDQLELPVLAYGLRSDFLGEPFEGSLYLLVWAEKIIEIKTICYCGRKATMNMRIDEHGQMVRSGEQIEIGGDERYIATCFKHYKEGNPLAEHRNDYSVKEQKLIYEEVT